ncbi:hypothetical protein [Hyphomicrobium sp. CS1GBMeth3]|uniref:hypothetical protein n=1 Tax=Hyphomicrobium sp. CS1GBMeth3 TaxID=1892845 RepID=UPI000931B663|nr:hypothetical protein [Hyphomicrobium sp. CS1GBMeth3]
MGARNAPRSLGAALRDAGLDDAAPDPRETENDAFETSPLDQRTASTAPLLTDYRSPSLALFTKPEAASPVAITPLQHESVVSPPPWLRAARRGRRRKRLLNTVGWVTTLVVTGTIIGIAGHFLAVSPTAIVTSMQQARQ